MKYKVDKKMHSVTSSAGCSPIWMKPSQDERAQVATCVTPEALLKAYHQAMAQGRPPKAAVVVSPTYFGSCSDIQGDAPSHPYGFL